MKFIQTLLLSSILYLIPATSLAGFHFPNEDFSYAKVYYLNLGALQNRPDSYLYSNNSGWASSVIDIDQTSSKALTENIEKLFLYGADGLLTGLSSCFVPRHGLVYFDQMDHPVASLSVCFECGGIRMWTKSQGKIQPKNTGSSKRAEQQIETLETFFKKENIIVSENDDAYSSILASKALYELLEEDSTVTLTFHHLNSKIIEANYLEAKQWLTSGSFQEDVNVEYSAGNEKYEFAELLLTDGTTLLFDGPSSNSILAEGTILNSNVVLPDGIHVGSSTFDVLQTIGVDAETIHPSLLIFKDDQHSIGYHFQNDKVSKIEINLAGQ